MDTTARILLEQIGLLVCRVAVAAGHIEAVNEEFSERFIVRGDEVCELAVEVAGTVGSRYARRTPKFLVSGALRPNHSCKRSK